MNRRAWSIILMVLVISSAWALVPRGTWGALASGVTASKESSLIELGKKYMPVLKFPGDEKFYPRDVKAFLAVSYLVCGNQVIESSPVKFENMPSGRCVYEQTLYEFLGHPLPLLGKYTLDKPFLFPTTKYIESEIKDFVRNKNIPWPSPEERRDELYEIEKNLGDDYVQYLNGKEDSVTLPGISTNNVKLVLLQYWFFYLYDLFSVNAHDGDWEHVTVVLLDDGDILKPIGVYYAQHFFGEFKPWDELEICNNTHPVVYVGEGSHASYPSKSRWQLNSAPLENLGDDIILTSDKVKLELIDSNKPMWKFDGYWGFYSWELGIRKSHPPETPTARDIFWNPLSESTSEVLETLKSSIINIHASSNVSLFLHGDSVSVTLKVYAPYMDNSYGFVGGSIGWIDGTLVIKLRDPYGNNVYTKSFPIHLLRGTTESFTFNWTVPSDAVEGPYEISADVIKDDGSYYYDTLGWQHIFDVVVPRIVQPTTNNPVYVGSKNDPKAFPLIVHLGGTSELTSSDFSVALNGTRTKALLVTSDLNGNYYFKVYPPTQKVGGRYNLEVTIKAINLTLTEEASVIYSNTSNANADIELVIDRSGSMGGEKMENAKKAAKDFVNLVQFGDYLGIVSFSSSARVEFPLTNITNESVKHIAIQAIDSIYAGGSTSIGAGLKAAFQELINRGSPNPDYIVLMTDGQENTPPYVGKVLPDIKSKGITVYTVGFGADADSKLLSDIARETGGIYYFAPTSWDIRAIYQQIAGHVTGKQTISSKKITLFKGQSTIQSVYVDPTVSLVTFSITWQGSDVNLTLIAPNGSIITPNVAEENPNINYTKGDTYVIYEIKNPLPGEWKMNITAIDVPKTGEEVTTIVLADTNLAVDLFTEKNTYKLEEPIRLIGVLTLNGTTINGDVNATIVRPDGSIENLQLLDDNKDGVYETYYVPDESGDYTITIRATGKVNGVPFTRQTTFSVYVSSEKMSKGLVSSIDKLNFETVSGRTLSVYLTFNSTTQDIFRIGVTGLSSENRVIGPDYEFMPSIVSLIPGDTLTIVGNITVPFNVTPGVYTGKLVLQGTHNVLSIPIEVKVKPRLQYAPDDIELYSTDVGVESIEVYEVSENALKQITREVPEVKNLRAFLIASTGFGNFKLRFSNISEVENIAVFKYDFESKEWKQASFEVGSVILPLSVNGFNVELVIIGETETSPTEKTSSHTHTNIFTLAHLWTTWFFKYHDEFVGLHKNATTLGIDNETLSEALELHQNATNIIIDAWWGRDLPSIRNILWATRAILPIPKFWEIRKAYLMEKEAVELLKQALTKYQS